MEHLWPPGGLLSLLNTIGGLFGFPNRGNAAATVLAAAALVVVLLLLCCLVNRRHHLLPLIMDIDPSTADNNSGLPFPGGMVDGKMATRFFNIDKPKKPGLQDLCRGFGLGISGNKDELKARKRAFSSNREEWQRLVPAPRRMHHGPETGKVAKIKSVKQSARRAEEIFNSASRLNELVPHLPNHLPTQEATTTRTQSEAILGWARAILTAHPYLSKEDCLEAGKARLWRVVAAPHQVTFSTTNPTNLLDYTNVWLDQIATSLSIMSSIGGITPSLAPPSIPSTFTLLAPTPLGTSSPTAPASNPNPNPVPVPVPSTGGKLKLRSWTIILGDGTRHVEFTADNVGPPPAISFANDLPQLNRMWDDTSEYWDGHSVLVIKGVPHRHWKRAKGSWCEWKSIVKQWRQSSEEEFWKEFSDASGHKFSYTSIVDRLSQLQKEEDRKWADCARAHYGEEFKNVFFYKKSGVLFVKTKDCEIAKQFRQELAKQKQNLPPTAIADFAESDMDLDSD
ncbi:hypothetical protein BYT27DRAFT_7261332 [Phlegmacium glaucopus]|nr:hypothetical protein BYT27DRAFT_7261332 [Phlegmacium glaucopus]